MIFLAFSGADTFHSVINICVIWLLLKLLGGTSMSVALAFLFNTVSIRPMLFGCC